ncbi:MAG: pantoate--beta-alanine ligase [Verrucomicrobiaceae bacterium]|nr:pantoate--beta-alanine ligase [Verrucomicrobiaceae bacterium]
MNVINNIRQVRSWHTVNRGARCVFVPTMGALHEGHAALIRAAREIAGSNGNVVVSIFVNPLQFGPGEDLEKYPRSLVEDLSLCRDNGTDMIFAPKAEELYPADRSIVMRESSLSQMLCGASRPGHFDGVCTVVAKLFNLVQCDDAVFGKKDFQQLAIIRRLVRDLDFNVVLHAIDTVREPDGLAMSSRNRYLTPEERAQAPALHAALKLARDTWKNDGERDPAALVNLIKKHLQQHAPLGRVDYVSAVDAVTLQPVSATTELVVVAAAVFFGGARLIDNIELK